MLSRYTNLEIIEQRTIKTENFKLELILNEENCTEERFYIKNKLFEKIPESVKSTSDYLFMMIEKKQVIKDFENYEIN